VHLKGNSCRFGPQCEKMEQLTIDYSLRCRVYGESDFPAASVRFKLFSVKPQTSEAIACTYYHSTCTMLHTCNDNADKEFCQRDIACSLVPISNARPSEALVSKLLVSVQPARKVTGNPDYIRLRFCINTNYCLLAALNIRIYSSATLMHPRRAYLQVLSARL